MNFTITHAFSKQARVELHIIDQLEDLIEFGSKSWLTRAVENISSTVQMATNMLFNAVTEVAICIHKLIKWLWLADTQSEREATKQLWNSLVAGPVKWLTLPLRIFNEPLYRKIALKVDKNSYVTTLRASYVPEACVLETLERDFAKDNYLLFEERVRSIQEIQRFVHTLKEVKETPTEDEYLAFYSDRLQYRVSSVEEIRRRYMENQGAFVTEVKQALCREYLHEKEVADVDELVEKAFQLATQETWKAIKLALKRFGVQICLEQNNMIVSPDKRVFLELKFVNFVPSQGAWTVRDIIQANSEHHEGCLQFELTGDAPGELSVMIGDGNTGSRPTEMQGGVFIPADHT